MIEVICKICGSNFFNRPLKGRPRTYCSKKCYIESRKRKYAEWNKRFRLIKSKKGLCSCCHKQPKKPGLSACPSCLNRWIELDQIKRKLRKGNNKND